MPTATPKFYRSDLPPRPQDIERVRKTLSRGTMSRRDLIERSGLTQTRALCAVDALIASGEVSFDAALRSFSLSGGSKPSTE